MTPRPSRACAPPSATAPALLAVLLLVLAPGRAQAVELADGRLSLVGFGGAAVGRSWGNPYLHGTPEGNASDAYLTLSLLAKPQDALTLAGQVELHLRSGQMAPTLDWAFAEYRFADALRLRLGQAKLPKGLYGEVTDVGTLRPFYSLPQGTYGPGELDTEHYIGVGVTGQLLDGLDWGLEYDAAFGLLSQTTESPLRTLMGLPTVVGPMVVLGARLAVQTPVPGLRVLGTLGRTSPRPSGVPALDVGPLARRGVTAPGLSVELARERLLVRAEGFLARVDGAPDAVLFGFVEVAGFVLGGQRTGGLQLAARVDAFDQRVPEPLGALGRHRDLALGLNYWFTPQFAVKASHHWVRGNRFASPADLSPALLAAGGLDGRTRLLQLGAHFAF